MECPVGPRHEEDDDDDDDEFEKPGIKVRPGAPGRRKATKIKTLPQTAGIESQIEAIMEGLEQNEPKASPGIPPLLPVPPGRGKPGVQPAPAPAPPVREPVAALQILRQSLGAVPDFGIIDPRILDLVRSPRPTGFRVAKGVRQPIVQMEKLPSTERENLRNGINEEMLTRVLAASARFFMQGQTPTRKQNITQPTIEPRIETVFATGVPRVRRRRTREVGDSPFNLRNLAIGTAAVAGGGFFINYAQRIRSLFSGQSRRVGID